MVWCEEEAKYKENPTTFKYVPMYVYLRNYWGNFGMQDHEYGQIKIYKFNPIVLSNNRLKSAGLQFVYLCAVPGFQFSWLLKHYHVSDTYVHTYT